MLLEQRRHDAPSLLGACYCCWNKTRHLTACWWEGGDFCLRVKKRASKTHKRTHIHTVCHTCFSHRHSPSCSHKYQHYTPSLHNNWFNFHAAVTEPTFLSRVDVFWKLWHCNFVTLCECVCCSTLLFEIKLISAVRYLIATQEHFTRTLLIDRI